MPTNGSTTGLPSGAPQTEQDAAAAAMADDAIRKAERAARAAGPSIGSIVVLTAAELEAPIELERDSQSDDRSENVPAVNGYLLEEKIDRGGQATVYRAVQISTGRSVAIKVLPGGYFATQRALARFDREVDGLVRVHHPNVIQVIDQGRTRDGSPYLVMPFVDGPTLDHHLSPDTDPVVVANLFAKIASAVHELHQQGIVHRDLKPSNVRVDHRGEPYVLDFGLVDLAETQTMTDVGQVLGSLPWASPEQARGDVQSIDARSDIYAIGVMLATAIDGKPPYPTSGPTLEIIQHILETRPQIKGENGRGPLAEIARKCLAKEPAQRYQTAAELEKILQSVARGGRVAKFKDGYRLRGLSQAIVVITLILLIGATIAAYAVRWSETAAKDLHVPVSGQSAVVQLPRINNSLQMRLVEIPAGEFEMGSPSVENGHSTAETIRTVRIKTPFWIAVTETDQREYQQVMGRLPRDIQPVGPDLPVSCVTWDDAIEFCRRLSVIEHRQYRLPTEAEWEYASRASAASLPFGGAELAAVGWYSGNSGGGPHPVGRLQPNAWGLYDMHGNVSEWCSDDFAGVPDQRFGLLRHARGGSWSSSVTLCRSASSVDHFSRWSSGDVGFRVAADAVRKE